MQMLKQFLLKKIKVKILFYVVFFLNICTLKTKNILGFTLLSNQFILN
jgi:hypothetical protein